MIIFVKSILFKYYKFYTKYLTRQNKDMKKVIINPFDKQMEVRIEALKILNDYKVAGFTKRESFVELVMSEDTSFHNYNAMTKLNNFWSGRVADEELNSDLERILDKIRVA